MDSYMRSVWWLPCMMASGLCWRFVTHYPSRTGFSYAGKYPAICFN